MKVNVVGAGSWGTALAILLGRNGHEVVLSGRDPDEMESLRRHRENLRYLPGFLLPETVLFSSLAEAPADADMMVLAIPSAALREVAGGLGPGAPLVVVAAKGLEAGTGRTMAEIAAEAMPAAQVGAISGPNLAVEIVRGIPTAAVAAYAELAPAETVRTAFTCRTFRVYITDDLLGVELAGALKNVLAIGAGLSDGLGFGDNTKGALLARGLREMTALGVAMEADPETFMGIAGVGDLFATATSVLSRNYRLGVALAKGKSLSAALEELGQVAEGVGTSDAAQLLAGRHGVEMPVFAAIEAVIHGRLSPAQGVSRLMERNTPFEMHPLQQRPIG